MNFSPISHKSENFHTYKTFTWTLKLDSQDLQIYLEIFKLTNKRQISFNSTLIFTGHKPYFKDFDFTYNLNKHILAIHNSKSLTDLLIDGISFHALYTHRTAPIHEESKTLHPIAKPSPIPDTVPSSTSFSLPSSNYDFDFIFK